MKPSQRRRLEDELRVTVSAHCCKCGHSQEEHGEGLPNEEALVVALVEDGWVYTFGDGVAGVFCKTCAAKIPAGEAVHG